MAKVIYMCRSCSKKKHNTEQEAEFCKLWHQEMLEWDDLVRYMELMDELIEIAGVTKKEGELILWDPDQHNFYAASMPIL